MNNEWQSANYERFNVSQIRNWHTTVGTGSSSFATRPAELGLNEASFTIAQKMALITWMRGVLGEGWKTGREPTCPRAFERLQ